MANDVGTATLTDCTVWGNSATGLAAASTTRGTATLTDCTVSGNSATYGGGMCNHGDADADRLHRLRQLGGHFGGGMFNDQTRPP